MESAKFYMVSWRDISRSGSCIPHLPSSIPCFPREEKLTSALRKHVKTGEMWVYLKNVGAPEKCGNVIWLNVGAPKKCGNVIWLNLKNFSFTLVLALRSELYHLIG